MDLSLTQHIVYLPPLILAALVTFYRNTILCFWDCTPLGVTIKQFHGQIAIRLSDLLAMLAAAAKILYNGPLSVVYTLSHSVLHIATMIQGILVASIYYPLVLVLSSVMAIKEFLVMGVLNCTTFLYTATHRLVEPVPFNYDYLFITLIVLVVSTRFVLYRYRLL